MLLTLALSALTMAADLTCTFSGANGANNLRIKNGTLPYTVRVDSDELPLNLTHNGKTFVVTRAAGGDSVVELADRNRLVVRTFWCCDVRNACLSPYNIHTDSLSPSTQNVTNPSWINRNLILEPSALASFVPSPQAQPPVPASVASLFSGQIVSTQQMLVRSLANNCRSGSTPGRYTVLQDARYHARQASGDFGGYRYACLPTPPASSSGGPQGAGAGAAQQQ